MKANVTWWVLGLIYPFDVVWVLGENVLVCGTVQVAVVIVSVSSMVAM